MAESLPLRAKGPPTSGYAVPLVAPPGVELGEREGPRVYIAPLGSSADQRILRAGLAAAGLPPPRWVPSRRGRVAEDRLRQAFLAGEPFLVPLAAPRRGPDRLARLLRWARQAGREALLIPVEVLWGPADRVPSLWNLLLGNPYDPPEWSRWLRLRARGGVRLILGRPGGLGELAAQAPDPNDALALSAFVRGQAIKALSQTERQVLGERYKVPRFVVEQILSEPEFRDRVAAAGSWAGLTRGESHRQAERALHELATGHHFLYMEAFRRFCRWLYTKVYDPEIVVDPQQIQVLRELGRQAPLVFIPSHKSNFDHLVLYYLLFTSGFPPPHTAAGENMAFFPMSRVLPRTGAYFIRRSFQDDPVYKESMAGFIDYLVQRRFHQEFFIEGGRTRSGKQLPPRYGLLRYIIEGSRRRGIEDVRFVPTAITYDQLLEVREYARQLGGVEKERESFAFLVRLIRSLRNRDLGRVYVRFAAPIALREHLERSGEERLVVEKLAFQIANQINAVTPLTAVSIVCSALLGAGRRALTLPELEAETQRMLDYATERDVPVARELEQGAKATVEAAVEALCASRLLDVYDAGLEAVYSVAEARRLVASYYRNTIIHHFLVRAITSLAREAADAEGDVGDWALRLRELLKFEFFFSEREPFLAEVETEAARLGREQAEGLPSMGAAGPGILLDYLESYWVVTEALRTLPPGDCLLDEAELLGRCHSIGRQRLLQDRVHAPELLSSLNFRNALKLAANLGAARGEAQGYGRGEPRALDTLTRDLERLARLARSARSAA